MQHADHRCAPPLPDASAGAPRPPGVAGRGVRRLVQQQHGCLDRPGRVPAARAGARRQRARAAVDTANRCTRWWRAPHRPPHRPAAPAPRKGPGAAADPAAPRRARSTRHWPRLPLAGPARRCAGRASGRYRQQVDGLPARPVPRAAAAGRPKRAAGRSATSVGPHDGGPAGVQGERQPAQHRLPGQLHVQTVDTQRRDRRRWRRESGGSEPVAMRVTPACADASATADSFRPARQSPRRPAAPGALSGCARARRRQAAGAAGGGVWPATCIRWVRARKH